MRSEHRIPALADPGLTESLRTDLHAVEADVSPSSLPSRAPIVRIAGTSRTRSRGDGFSTDHRRAVVISE
jgi:hypothetical protein